MASVSKLPTAPIAGTIHWLNACIERGRSGPFSEITTVTPGLAGELLRRNEDNRNIKQTKAQHFAADMLSGRWTFNGEPIIISVDGSLNDGQHRLHGLIEANTTLPMMLVFGVTRESRMTVDQGSARCAGDYLSMGGTLYAKNAATAAKFIIAFERSEGRNITQRSKITNAEIVARVRVDDAIVKSAQFAHHHLKSYRHLVSHTVMATCHYLLSDIDTSDAVEFLNQVALGENIRRANPAYAVRSAFLNEKRERQDAMEVIFHGWNKFRSGGDLKLIRVNGSFPGADLMKTLSIRVDDIEIGERHRALSEDAVARLASSLAEIGLRQPISVRVVDEMMVDGHMTSGVPVLVAGRHRLEAAKRLSWSNIDCLEVDDDQLRAELWEIDENLIRAELSPAQQAEHLARRKAVWSALQASGTNCSTKNGFAADTAKKTGGAKQDINRHIKRANDIGPDIKLVAGTSLDSGVELDALAKMPEADRRPLIARAAAGEAVTARPPINGYDVVEKQVDAVMAAWNKACPEARERVRDLIDEPVFDKTRSGARR